MSDQNAMETGGGTAVMSENSSANLGLTGGSGPLLQEPDEATLERIFALKYGAEDQLGWGPRLRRDYGYFNPDDWYEAFLAGTVAPGMRWLDVGCGRDLFPSNVELASSLSARVGKLAGLDPDETLQENPFVHEKIERGIDGFDGGEAFDLVTLRMVAEHIDNPQECAQAIERSLAPGGLCIIYTVFGYSPMPLLTRAAPMSLRHVVKKWLWNTEEKDTFPTRFRMNTRGKLRQLMRGVGLREEFFVRLDDCRTFSRFRWMCELELRARSFFRLLRMPYPEHCVLGVYRKS